MKISRYISVDELDLDGVSDIKIEILEEVLKWYQIYDWIEKKVDVSYSDEEEAAAAVDKILAKYSVEEIAEEILGRKLNREERLKMGLTAIDEETGKEYVLVEEDERQMMLFDGMERGKVRKYLDEERRVA